MDVEGRAANGAAHLPSEWVPVASVEVSSVPPASPTPHLTRLSGVGAHPLGDLSRFFNPFLTHFMRETLRCGGEVWASTEGADVNGILIFNSVELQASIFTRNRDVAETLFRWKGQVSVFSEFPLGPAPEVYHIYAIDHPEWNRVHRFAHPVRAAEPSDRALVMELVREVYGRVDESWFDRFPPENEACFVVDGADGIAGAAWAAVVNQHGQLHTLTVRPRYRRTGVGTDLWYARMDWTRSVGAHRVLCEVADRNLGSRAIAEAGGMRPVGQIFQSYRS